MKRYLLLTMLCVLASVGVKAYNFPGNSASDVENYGGGKTVCFYDNGDDTQMLVVGAGGLAEWLAAADATQQGYLANTSRTKLVVSGTLNADDFAALNGTNWQKFIEVDMSGVTVADPSAIKGIGLPNATKIKLPGDCADYAEASTSMWPKAEMIVGYKSGGTLGVYTKTAGHMANALRFYGSPFPDETNTSSDLISSSVTPANLKLAGEFAWNDLYTKVNNSDLLWGGTDSSGNKFYACGLSGFDSNLKKTLSGYVDLSQVVFKDESYTPFFGDPTPQTKTVSDCWQLVKNFFPSHGDNPTAGATELMLPVSTQYTTIPADLMNGGSGNGAKETLKKIIIPDNYTTIEKRAFAYCTGMELVYIPSSIQNVGMDASTAENDGDGVFQGCISLKDVEFQSRTDLLNLGPHTFDGCTGLKHINLPTGSTVVAEYMFNNCTSLDAVRLPNTVVDIKDGAFQTCTSLKTIAIPWSVRTMGYNVFNGTRITDLYLMARTVDEIPTIYSLGFDTKKKGTFGASNVYFNNTDPGDQYATSASPINDKFTDQVEADYRDALQGGNTLTFLHYNQNVRNVIDYNPWQDKTIAQLDDSQNTPASGTNLTQYGSIFNTDVERPKLVAAEYLSDSYGNGPDKQGRCWPKQIHGDFSRCLAAGDPTIDLNKDGGSSDAYIDPWHSTGVEPSIIGWRQFALKVGFEEDNPEDHYENLYDNTWYTMCFPFDLTNDQLAGAFNPGYNICEFNGVATVKDANDKDAIVFYFTQVAKTHYPDGEGNYYTRVKDEDGNDLKDANGDYQYEKDGVVVTKSSNTSLWNTLDNSDGVMALAGHPYMIHPDQVEDQNQNATECVLQKVKYIDRYNILTDETEKAAAYRHIKQIYLDNAVTQYLSTQASGNAVENTNDTKVTLTPIAANTNGYTFIGRFLPKKEAVTSSSVGYLAEYDELSPKGLIPRRGYFLGVEGTQKYPKYYQEMGAEDRTTGYWSQFSAIIIPDEDAKSWEDAHAGTSSSVSGAKSWNVGFYDVEMTDVTAIKKIVADAEAKGQDVKYMDVIVNINGQVIRRGTTSIAGLPSGIYIVNGKKYFVK